MHYVARWPRLRMRENSGSASETEPASGFGLQKSAVAGRRNQRLLRLKIPANRLPSLDTLMQRIYTRYAERMASQADAPRPAGSAIGLKENELALYAAQDLGVDLRLARVLVCQVVGQT